MAGFFGSERLQAMQRATVAQADRIANTRGLVDGRRVIGIDDPAAIGWPAMQAMLDEHGMLAFRLITPAQERDFVQPLAARGLRIDRWDVLVGEAAQIRPRVEAILAPGLPEGVHLAPALTEAEGERMREVQGFLAANGVTPFPGSALVEAPGQSSVLLVDDAGAPAAFAHTYRPHNRFSPFHRHATVGLVAVGPAMRGRKLGVLVNAMALQRALERLDPDRLYESVASSNEASRRMVEAAGLAIDPNLLICAAMRPELPRASR